MKKIVFSLLMAMMAFVTVAMAQPNRGGDPYERADRQTQRMKEQLELTAEQTEKVSEINIAAAEKMHEARQAANGDWESMRETMMAIRQESSEALKGVLTEEQWTKFETMRQNMRPGGQGRMGQGNQGKKKGKKDTDVPNP